jgi:hypothetical protein
MSTHPPFDKLNMPLGGQICQALRAQRVLFSYVETPTGPDSYLFVLGPDIDTMLAELKATPEFPVEATYLVPVTEEILHEVEQTGVTYKGAAEVFDTSGKLLGELKTYGDFAIEMRTEHGWQPAEVLLADRIRKGDIFASGERNEHGDCVLYRALQTWRPFEDIPTHLLTSGQNWDTADPAARQALTKTGLLPANVILFRVLTASTLLNNLKLKDISK